jgi:hypothetical protein
LFGCFKLAFILKSDIPVAMTLDDAKQLIEKCAKQMHRHYEKPVFDEWAILVMANGKGRVLAYIGNRKEEFKKNFAVDAGTLSASFLGGQYNPGDFEFARDGIGTGFESFLVLGKDMYLICNNTSESMDGISKDPKWLIAQVPFVEMSEQFRTDPLLIQAGS